MKKLWLSIISAFAAVGAHTYLTVHHFQLVLHLGEGSSLCNLNQTFNCDAVTASAYSNFFGIPVALPGLFANLALACVLLALKFDLFTDRQRVLRYALWLQSLILAFSLVMAYISSFVLNVYCLFCILAYVLAIFGFVFVLMAQESKSIPHFGSDLRSLFDAHRWVLIVALIIPGTSWLFNKMILDSYGYSRMAIMIEESISHWQAAAPQTFDISSGLAFQAGAQPAKLTIVEFADYLCPHCKTAYPVLQSFASGRPDVKLVFKFFPLDGTCNADVQRIGDGLRCKLAYTTYCAEKIGKKGWDAHHLIFDHQEKFAGGMSIANLLEKIEGKTGLSVTEMQTCIDSDEVINAVKAQAKEGFLAKVQGTPAIFVENRKLDMGQFLPVLEAAYEAR